MGIKLDANLVQVIFRHFNYKNGMVGVFSIPYMTNRPEPATRQHGSRFMVAAGGLESGLNTAVNAAPLMIAPRLGIRNPTSGDGMIG